MNFENKIQIGIGCYTVSEIAHILQLPYTKVDRWLRVYWDGKLGKQFGEQYSWKTDRSRAVSFHTLIEFYIMAGLSEAGVKPKQVLNAHKLLSERYATAFPFAQKKLLEGLKTDGTKIYLTLGEDTLTLDGTDQFNLDLIRLFFKKLDFGSGNVAERFWPMGKKKSVVIDPKRQMGHPVLANQNIYPETLFNLYKGGDNVEFIAYLYELDLKSVKDAIAYSKAA